MNNVLNDESKGLCSFQCSILAFASRVVLASSQSSKMSRLFFLFWLLCLTFIWYTLIKRNLSNFDVGISMTRVLEKITFGGEKRGSFDEES